MVEFVDHVVNFSMHLDERENWSDGTTMLLHHVVWRRHHNGPKLYQVEKKPKDNSDQFDCSSL